MGDNTKRSGGMKFMLVWFGKDGPQANSAVF
jgi:hypothetical protein